MIAPSVGGAVLLVILTLSAFAQSQRGGSTAASRLATPPTLPPASDPAVKARLDHEQNIKDAARLAQLVAEVRRDLDTGADSTLAVASLKRLEEVAKLSKTLHDRMRGDNASAPK